MLKICQQMLQQKMTLLTTIFVIHIALAFVVTDLQVESVLNLYKPPVEIDTK